MLKMSPGVDKHFLIKLLVARRLRQRLKRKQREISIRPIFLNRMQQGDSILVQELRDDPHYHHRYFRMTKENFDEILRLISPNITGKITHVRPISPTEKLAITLRYLASGNSQISIALSYRVSPSSVSKILREVLPAIRNAMSPTHLPKPKSSSWTNNEEGFRLRWNFPNAVGAMDGKHIRVQAPSLSGSNNFNYKGYFSVVLMAVVGPDYRFTVVDIGASGSQSDGGIFSRSEFGRRLENQQLGIPGPKLVGDSLLPHVITGDDAFPLKSYIMKPYPGKSLTVEKRIFNYRLSRARMVVENTFGILAARWRIFHSPISADRELVLQIVECSVVLHNYLINKNDLNTITTDRESNGEMVNGNWRETTRNDTGITPIRHQGSNNFAESASSVREGFTTYFSSENGSVSWQNQSI